MLTSYCLKIGRFASWQEYCSRLRSHFGYHASCRDDTQPSGLERIRGELVAALSAISSVRSIDSFGSIATGSADQWSDLDLLISCEAPEHTAWLAAAAIRSTRRVAFYHMFTGVSQPSGRYWFCNESPFHRLDVSFYSRDGPPPGLLDLQGFLSALVKSYRRAHRPLSVIIHSARIQPASSILCSAGYNEPSSARSTSPDML
jgi:hypothetical protein